MFFHALGLNKAYSGKPVLRDVSFSVEKGGIVSILGPSGVGKTTLLKILAGLEKPDSGEVRFSEPLSRERPAILVFQDYVLFPNLTVFENVAFGLRSRRVTKEEVRARVMELLVFFGMDGHDRKYPNQLSAGQQQRVALARAMVVNPALLLLDEPFANLDRNLKLETAEFIRDTQKAFGVTTVAVTHDQEEAFAMSDIIGLILNGKLVQYAPAGEVYGSPASLEAARFLGPLNTLLPGTARQLGLSGEHECFRPEALELVPDNNGPARVEHVIFAGHYTRYRVAVGGQTLTVYGAANGIRPGDRVRVRVAESFVPQRVKS
ncbi:ABC transporter ATP-binding protein [Pseudodesulfovibrio tunisiensis]|uniref:ABC transporter ATP-binding protein n=1 Tax=Pseudodesulfovibrio tunisiensis TaxID=463192 RepID=UPI001FB3FA1B|nr:ABC transporter ATP-binding protein [Pseudodesulfovibrio tunisiensis]